MRQMRTLAQNPIRTAKAGVAYFALVFGAGFVLGSIRVPILVPRLGERMAELIEMPFMFVVVLCSARFIIRRFALPTDASVRLTDTRSSTHVPNHSFKNGPVAGGG